ncbi:mucin-5AC [Drosophila madeirensis]|uniref:Mucin-5AC n=1 Tax=Drosophila madeirensis TaxID=30013 RepID=A0AAU9FGX1_DROMD
MSHTPLIALLLLLLAAAQAAPAQDSPADAQETVTTPTPPNEEEESSSLSPVESGTFTIDFVTDLILTTDARGEIFSEATESPFGTTEEPLPESVVLQLEAERAQTAQPETTAVSEITTERPWIAVTKKSISDTTLGTTTTEPTKGKNLNSYFQGKPGTTGTANLVEDNLVLNSEEDQFEAKMGATMLPLIIEDEVQLVPTPRILPEVEESRTEAGLLRLATTEAVAVEQTTLETVQEDKETSTVEAIQETTELSSTPLSTFTQAQLETTTETIETTTNAPITTTSAEPVLLTTKRAIVLEAQPETTAANVMETSSSLPITTLATETETATGIPTTNVPRMSSAETTTPAPETTIPPTQVPSAAPITTSSAIPTSSPITTSTPESTTTFATSTTVIPETPTTTTNVVVSSTPAPRPVQTRAPRVERIFNSDGVEVLYGYSSVVRTNRS